MNLLYLKFFRRHIFLAVLLVLPVFALHSYASEEHHSDQKIVKGPHHGRLLSDGDFTLELAIFERGVPPEYRAWANYDGAVIAPEDWQLRVELTRLGGQVDVFTFAPQDEFLLGKGVVEEPHSFDVAVTAVYQNQKHHWAFPAHEGRVELTAEIAADSGLTTAVAGPGTLQQQVKLYGQITADPEQVRKLTARFPGVIRSLKVSVGDQVNAGDVLASVEADESLRSYDITAPISGLVVARQANEGESTGNKSLLTLADNRQLVANVFVFPHDAASVKAGQPVLIKTNTSKVRSTIDVLTPSIGGGAATITARVAIDNAQQQWTPGEWVNAHITTAEIPTPLLVDNRGLQEFRDWHVVFIQVGETYEIRPLELGRTDGEFTEVLGGLNAGDTYVVENSYLLKADLEKSGAAHDH